MNRVDDVYRPALSTGELIDVVRALLAEQRVAERLLGRYLADLADRIAEARRSVLGVLEPLRAYGDVYHAARCLFALGVRRTRELVRIGRALRTLPVTERAFIAGEIAYSRVREITRVARPEDEARWVAMATSLPMRTLERRVAEAAGTSRAERVGEPATASWVSPDSLEVRLQLRAETWALLQRAMEGARRASDGEGLLRDDEALMAVARDALGAQAGGAGAGARRTVVLYECHSCQRLELETGNGAVELGDGAAAAIACGAGVVDLRTAGRVERRGGPMPASVERAVRLRDRDRCRVPGCGRRRYVDVHHLQPRARGGGHARRNCVCLCETHHRRLHEGALSARGDAEGALVFLDSMGRPIGGRGDGDRSLDGSDALERSAGGRGDAEDPLDGGDAPESRGRGRRGVEIERHAKDGFEGPLGGQAAVGVTQLGSSAGADACRDTGAVTWTEVEAQAEAETETETGARGGTGTGAEVPTVTRMGAGFGSGNGAGLGASEARVLAVMGARGGWDADALAVATGLHQGTLAAALMSLELGGKVTMDFVGRYAPAVGLDARLLVSGGCWCALGAGDQPEAAASR